MIENSVVEVEKSNVISLDKKREEKLKDSSDEYFEKMFIFPEILFIHAYDDRIGKWSHPLADNFIINGQLYSSIFDDEADEEMKELDLLHGKDCSGPLLRMNLTIGEKESKQGLQAVLLLDDKDWNRVIDEWGNEETPLTDFLYATVNFFLSIDEQNTYQPGIDYFKHTEYCKKLNETYDLENSDIYYWVSGDCFLNHKDGKFTHAES